MDKNGLNEYKSLLNAFQDVMKFDDVMLNAMLSEEFRSAYEAQCSKDGAATVPQKTSVLASLYIDKVTNLQGEINQALGL